jgi:hypothetical protein
LKNNLYADYPREHARKCAARLEFSARRVDSAEPRDILFQAKIIFAPLYLPVMAGTGAA